jgi:hypothetical protein
MKLRPGMLSHVMLDDSSSDYHITQADIVLLRWNSSTNANYKMSFNGWK